MDNILSNTPSFNKYDIKKLALAIKENVRTRRLELNLTQNILSKRSGVSFGTLKHFERYNEISLKHLLMLAVALDATEEFGKLFSERNYNSISEVINGETAKKKKRARSDKTR
jgi:transcriptional regulator with XRE-family HTH domain